MSVVRLSEYFFVKYAADKEEEQVPDTIRDQDDMSFGVPITAEKTRILKDKLILVYDKLNAKITKLPAFQQMNEELAGNQYLVAFNDAINDLVVSIERSTLKEGFSYAMRMIEALAQLRNYLRFSGMEQDKKIQLDLAIKNVQDTIWKEGKSILNIHDLRGIILKFPELKGIIDKAVPTWQYGPMKTPVKKPIKQYDTSVSTLMKRLLKEIEKEKKP